MLYKYFNNSEKKRYGFFSLLKLFDDSHPYVSPSIIVMAIAGYLLLGSYSLGFIDKPLSKPESIQFLDINQIEIQHSKRIVKKNISAEGDLAETKTNVSKATGVSESDNAVDLSFFPNIVPPKLIGKLKKDYPKIAKDLNIEAIINVGIFISSKGRVKLVEIIGIHLNKSLPTDLHIKISKAFSEKAIKTLLGAKFSPPIVKGKNVSIKMEMPLRFKLN